VIFGVAVPELRSCAAVDRPGAANRFGGPLVSANDIDRLIGVVLPAAIGAYLLFLVLTGRMKNRKTGQPLQGSRRTLLIVAGPVLIAVGLLRLLGIG
jgi:hypothetical protein